MHATCSTHTPRLKSLLKLTLITMLWVYLSGCIPLAVGGAATVGGAAHDRRSFGTVIDDEGIEYKTTNDLYETAEIKSTDRIKVVSVNGIVLLAGEISSEEKKQLATEIASKVKNVRRVVNELYVREDVAGIGTRTSDRFLTGKVKTALFGLDIKGFDPTRVNVTTARKIVYLQGLVTREEGEAVAERVSRVHGVEGVVKVFEYVERKDDETKETPEENPTENDAQL